MKKLINDPYQVVNETISGILKAHPYHLRMTEGSERALVRADAPIQGKVAICTGGGSGHIPVFLGYVGPGLVDGVSIGNVFSSPSADDMLAVTKEVNGGAGVLYLFGNYQGDIMNFEMAAEMADMEDIRVEMSIGKDDVASAPRSEADRRRGVAGIFFAYKIAGAKADTMASLDEVKATTDAAIDNTCTMGVALTPCTIPAAGEPTFNIADDEMELGMGIHGEPGIERGKLKTADEVTEIMAGKIIEDLPFKSGDEVAILVNGLGATPPEELYIIYNKAYDLLQDHGLSIYRSYVGEYATSMEMAGASLSLLKLNDEFKTLLDAPAFSPFLPQWSK
ncbi:MAG: dihydroxyacetone kinase subunit DhaK [Dehalococcoidales bacterium]|nr:MAG: dihydroxyacetone kinase subunit DhaK [Dehalococcoidales bacterium]